MMSDTTSNQILLSTDTLPGYGLDMIFSLAQETGCDGIDLAIWKNFDTRHEGYVAKLSKQYKLPVVSVQTSSKINAKELNQAITIAQETGAKIIAMNAPSYFDVKPYTFLINNLKTYQTQYPDLTFSIINPDTASMNFLPLPKYRLRNIPEIIKKYHCSRWFDISAMDEEMIENLILIKMPDLASHISLCYVSDRKKNEYHLTPGTWNYDLDRIMESLRTNHYTGAFSIKLQFDPTILIDHKKVLFHIKKSIDYIRKS